MRKHKFFNETIGLTIVENFARIRINMALERRLLHQKNQHTLAGQERIATVTPLRTTQTQDQVWEHVRQQSQQIMQQKLKEVAGLLKKSILAFEAV